MKKIVYMIVLVCVFNLFLVFSSVSSYEHKFEDLDGFEWAEEAIYYFVDNNRTLTGPPPTKYFPDQSITRAEIVSMMVRLVSKPQSHQECDFKDVSSQEWYYDFIAQAQQMNIIHGDDEGYFHPDEKLSRQDAAVMLTNYLKLEGIQAPDNASAEYDDADLIASYALDSVGKLQELNIMVGYANCFEPTQPMNRAEACVAAYQAVKYVQSHNTNDPEA